MCKKGKKGTGRERRQREIEVTSSHFVLRNEWEGHRSSNIYTYIYIEREIERDKDKGSQERANER